MNTPNTITFQTTDSTWVMRITADRRIEVNEDVDVTEAAKKVLAAMQYLLQPKREWVVLTDEEMKKTWYEMQNIMGWYSFQEIANAVQAKIKEKNA